MKKRILLWCGVFTLLICLLTGCIKSMEEQIAEQLELGQKYLMELNYEEAIVAFTKAIELDEKNVDAYIGRGQVYEAMAQAAGEESADGMSYYEQAAGEYEQALSLSSENPFLYDRLFTIYQITGNLEAIQKIAEKDLSGITDETVLEKLEQIKTVLEAVEKIAEACEIGETDQVFELIDREEFGVLQEFVKEKEYPVFMIETGKGLGIYLYAGFAMIYYGDYQDGMRQGHGLWIGTIAEGRNYLAEGEWSDDLPNGYQKERSWNDGLLMQQRTGTVENGLWHGEAMETFKKRDGSMTEYPVSFEHGKYVVLRVEEYEEDVYYYIYEGDSNAISIENPDRIRRIAGF